MAGRPAAKADTRVSQCAHEIRSMVLSGALLPGQKVHQAELAELLNVSRIPVHAALATLESEGLLVHKPNSGYTVAQFSADELSQIYLMRRLLETELLHSIDLSAVDVDELEKLNRELDSISPREDLSGYQRANLRFHFVLFEYSPLALVRAEVSRLWYRSGYYRSLRLHLSDVASGVHNEHLRIIDAIRAHDMDALIAACDAHRMSTPEVLVGDQLRFGKLPNPPRSA